MPEYDPQSTTSPPRVARTGVLIYFLLTFAISWGGVVAVVGLDGFPGTTEAFYALLPMVVAAMLAGPSIAGIMTTVLHDGKEGLRDLWARFCTVRVNARWYAVALLTAPLLVVAVLIPIALFFPAFRPGLLTVGDPVTHLLVGLLTGVAAGLFEEIGWTGYATPQLRRRYSTFATGLLLGVVWGLWHLLASWWGSTETIGSVPVLVYLPVVLFSFLVPFRVLMVWVHDRTQSLFLAMLMHASLTGSLRVLDPVPISGWSIVVYNLLFGVALWIVVALIWRKGTGKS